MIRPSLFQTSPILLFVFNITFEFNNIIFLQIPGDNGADIPYDICILCFLESTRNYWILGDVVMHNYYTDSMQTRIELVLLELCRIQLIAILTLILTEHD